MSLVNKDSDDSFFNTKTSRGGNKMKVKLLMNNNTVEVDTPTSKLPTGKKYISITRHYF